MSIGMIALIVAWGVYNLLTAVAIYSLIEREEDNQ
jgi:hypothetical protein